MEEMEESAGREGRNDGTRGRPERGLLVRKPAHRTEDEPSQEKTPKVPTEGEAKLNWDGGSGSQRGTVSRVSQSEQ